MSNAHLKHKFLVKATDTGYFSRVDDCVRGKKLHSEREYVKDVCLNNTHNLDVVF